MSRFEFLRRNVPRSQALKKEEEQKKCSQISNPSEIANEPRLAASSSR